MELYEDRRKIETGDLVTKLSHFDCVLHALYAYVVVCPESHITICEKNL